MKAIKVGPYILRETLGSGSFADVKLGIHEETGRKFAIKVFDKDSINLDDFEREVRREVKIMQYLRHPNIVTVHQVLMSGTNMYVVMELVSGGELYYEIVKRRKIDERRARRYFQQLVDAMCYCHRKGVYHRDLKPENLLLDENDNMKITDFGMSWLADAEAGPDALLHTQCGTPKYMAPEVITKAKQGYRGDKIDVWDCAMVLFAMVAGYLPFNGDDDRQVFRQIVFGKVKYPGWFKPELCDLLSKMMEKDPKMRLSLDQVRCHPWFMVNYEGEEAFQSFFTVESPRRHRSKSREIRRKESMPGHVSLGGTGKDPTRGHQKNVPEFARHRSKSQSGRIHGASQSGRLYGTANAGRRVSTSAFRGDGGTVAGGTQQQLQQQQHMQQKRLKQQMKLQQQIEQQQRQQQEDDDDSSDETVNSLGRKFLEAVDINKSETAAKDAGDAIRRGRSIKFTDEQKSVGAHVDIAPGGSPHTTANDAGTPVRSPRKVRGPTERLTSPRGHKEAAEGENSPRTGRRGERDTERYETEEIKPLWFKYGGSEDTSGETEEDRNGAHSSSPRSAKNHVARPPSAARKGVKGLVKKWKVLNAAGQSNA